MEMRSRWLAFLAIGLGAAFGYLAASGQWHSMANAELQAPVKGVLAQGAPAAAKTETDKLDRTRLPIPEPQHEPVTQLDVRRATAPPRFEVTAPKGAPNIVIVLLDDMGFAHPSTFGGAIAMPTLDRLARNGLRYNNMHVTALCSPTRAALLTGRNHHSRRKEALYAADGSLRGLRRAH
jgi:arylsulfatase